MPAGALSLDGPMPADDSPRRRAYENGDQPSVSINVREYVDMTIANERALSAERMKAVAREFVTTESARVIAEEAAEQSRVQLAQQVTEKFVTIETARIIAKDEVERARVTLANQVEDARKALAALVQQQTRSEGSNTIAATRDEEARVAVAGLVKQQNREAGESTAARWFVPSGPALVSMVVAIIAVIVAVAALVLR